MLDKPTNHLVAQEVLASRDARGDRESDFALVRDHAVHTPGLVRDVETVFPDLEPLEASHVSLECVRDLGPLCPS